MAVFYIANDAPLSTDDFSLQGFLDSDKSTHLTRTPDALVVGVDFGFALSLQGSGLRYVMQGGVLTDVVGGRINSLVGAAFGYPIAIVSGLDISAEQVFNLQAQGKQNAFLNLIYRQSDTIFGTDFDDLLKGRGGNDTIYGGVGKDDLVGGAGADRLSGGADSDTFVFNAAPVKGNADITDAYAEGDLDTLVFDNDAFANIGPVGAMSSTRIAYGTSAADANDRLIYSAATGRLWYDADGTGAKNQVLVAVIASDLSAIAFDGTIQIID